MLRSQLLWIFELLSFWAPSQGFGEWEEMCCNLCCRSREMTCDLLPIPEVSPCGCAWCNWDLVQGQPSPAAWEGLSQLGSLSVESLESA